MLIAYQISALSVKRFKSWKNAKETTKGHNFVQNRTIEIPKSHAHLQITMKHSAQFQVNLIQDVAGVAGTRFKSARAITPLKMGETKIKNHMHIFTS